MASVVRYTANHCVFTYPSFRFDAHDQSRQFYCENPAVSQMG